MDGQRDDRLDRIEDRLDRLTQLAVCILICQPILLLGLLMPNVASLAVAYVLVALIIALALFPNLETKLPDAMYAFGAFLGRMQRRLRGFAPR